MFESILFILTVSRLRIQIPFMRIFWVLGLSFRTVSTRVGKFYTKPGFGIIISLRNRRSVGRYKHLPIGTLSFQNAPFS